MCIPDVVPYWQHPARSTLSLPLMEKRCCCAWLPHMACEQKLWGDPEPQGVEATPAPTHFLDCRKADPDNCERGWA